MRLKSRRGFSLMELSLTLGVVGSIIGGIFIVRQSTSDKAQAEILLQQTLRLVQTTRIYFAGRALPSTAGDVTTYSSKNLRLAKVFPEDMCNSTCYTASTGSAKNTYGNPAYVSLPVLGGVPVINQFKIGYGSQSDGEPGAPKDACMFLAMRLSSRAVEVGAVSFEINGTAITTFPIGLSTAKTNCTSSKSNVVTITFNIRN